MQGTKKQKNILKHEPFDKRPKQTYLSYKNFINNIFCHIHLIILLILNEFPWQSDDLLSVKPDAGCPGNLADRVLGDNVIPQLVFVHALGKGSLDAGALLVYGVVERIDKSADGIADGVITHTIGDLTIKVGEFFAIVCKALEVDTFLMIQEKKI